MIKTIEKQKVIEYTIPEGVDECGWMAVVAYRDPNDGHRHLAVPWNFTDASSTTELMWLTRALNYIYRAIRQFHKDEMASAEKSKERRTE